MCEATSDHEIRKTLRDLPKDLAETYNRILRKIKKSRGTSEKLDKVHKIFKWIICAERPLTIDELAEAIEIESTDKFWDSEKMTADGERLIRYCGSLVVFDKDTRAARLAHYTVQQFLTSVPVENSLACLHIDPATTNVQLGEACITYLSFSDFETQITRRRSPLPVGKTLLLDSAIDQVPFGKRLVKEVLTNWNHVRGAGSDGTNPVIDLTKHLVVSDGTIPLEKMHAKYRFLKYAIANWTWHTKMLTKDNQRLWNAFADVALKKPMTFEFRPWGKMQSQYDLQYPTIFNWAINAGHVALLHLIPYHDLDFYDIVTTQAQSSITAAARRGDTEVLKVLFQLPGLELRYLPTDEIVCDATDGRDELLELLLRLQANPNAESDKGRHALVCAFMRQQEAAFILLLQYGANADLECNKTAFDDNELMLFGPGSFPEQRIFKLLHLAVRTGHTACVSALLQRGAQVNIPLSSEFRGESPLQAAVSMRRHEIVEMLVHAGADVNAVDDNGMTALMFATIRCHFSVAQTLLEKGAAVNARSLTNRTALMEAAAKGNIHLVRLLLSAGAKIELLDQDWNTALDIARSSHARLEVLALLDDARIVQEQITPIIANPAISSGSLSMKIRNENSMSIGPIYSPWSPGPKAGSADSLGGADQGI